MSYQTDVCDWPWCREPSTVIYSVEGHRGLCQLHFAKFCKEQDADRETEVRATIKLPPRKENPNEDPQPSN